MRSCLVTGHQSAPVQFKHQLCNKLRFPWLPSLSTQSIVLFRSFLVVHVFLSPSLSFPFLPSVISLRHGLCRMNLCIFRMLWSIQHIARVALLERMNDHYSLSLSWLSFVLVSKSVCLLFFLPSSSVFQTIFANWIYKTYSLKSEPRREYLGQIQYLDQSSQIIGPLGIIIRPL